MSAAAHAAVARHARLTPGHEARIEQAQAVLRAAVERHPGTLVFATSLGVEDMVIADLIAAGGLPIPLATLQTGRLHAQTLALIPRLEQRYGLTVERFEPQADAVLRFVASHGDMAMRQSVELRKACCALRKLEPLSRALAGRTAWVTGLRREQSGARADLQPVQDDDNGREKISPLVDWTLADVWQYVSDHDVPYNPLHDDFYPSIGCEPCTRAVALGEDFRAGRWWWESESAKECGLHSPHSEAASAADSRSESSAPASAQAHIGAADVKGAQAPGRSQQESARECGLHVAHHLPSKEPA